MAKVLFFRCSKSQYSGLASVNPDALYFLEDAKQLYLGETNITECLVFVDSWNLPDLPVLGKFYLNTVTGEFKCCGPTGLRTIVPPVATSGSDFDDATKNDYIASIFAIKEYVQSAIQQTVSDSIKSITFNSYTGNIEAEKKDTTQFTQLRGVAHSPTYQGLTITIPVYGSEDVVINLPKDNFVRSGRYENDYPLPDPPGGHGPAIVLTVGDGDESQEVVIPAATIANVYSGGSTDSIDVTIDNNTNVVTASVKLSEEAVNILRSTDDGLLVDGSIYATRPSGFSAGEVVVSDGDGGFSRSNVLINYNSLEPGYLATGDVIAQAIATAISTATEALTAKVTTLENRLPDVVDNQFIIGQSNKHISSGKTAGGSTLPSAPSVNVLATELAVKTAADDAKTIWDEIEHGYVGYKFVPVRTITRNYSVKNASVDQNYPVENVCDDDISTIYYYSGDSNSSGGPSIIWNEPTYAGGPFILEVIYFAGPGGSDACNTTSPSISIPYMTGSSGASERINISEDLTQKELYARCIESGGYYKVVVHKPGQRGLTWRLDWGCEMAFGRGTGGPHGGYLGLGIAEVKLFVGVQ